MYLLIDIGNSALKWRLSTAQDQTLDQGQVWLSNWDFKKLSQLWLSSAKKLPIQAIGIASVSNPYYVRAIQDWAFAQGIKCQQATSQSSVTIEGRRLINGYEDPEQLGVDRWLAMLAVIAVTNQSFCVIDSGSATTVDYVTKEGQHLGGYIMPGAYMMTQSLVATTQYIQVQPKSSSQPLPTNTSAAVISGTEYMYTHTMLGLIDDAIAQGYQVYITGGEQQTRVKMLEKKYNEVFFCTNLVLDGLAQHLKQVTH